MGRDEGSGVWKYVLGREKESRELEKVPSEI